MVAADSLIYSLEGYPHSQAAVQYCLDVVSGDIPNCENIKLICQRCIDDFYRDNSPYYFDPEKADRAVKFIQLLPHVKGKWAGRKELLKLEPWQKFIVCMIFGWIDEDGHRRYQKAYIKISRKNGKSILAAAIGLYMLCADGEHAAEVYCGATNEDQANFVFEPAKAMARNARGLIDKYDVEINAKSIVRLNDLSTFKRVIGTPGDGGNPHMAIHDEYHEHKDDSQVETMATGMVAREQPFQLIITTAGSNTGGPCFQEERYAEKVLRGTEKDDNLFPVMYGIDKDDNWSDPGMIQKANPNLGVSVTEKYLNRELERARKTARKQNAFRTKHLNQWVGAKTAWLPILNWLACKSTRKFDGFEGEYCHGAVDLASRKDVAAVVLLWKRGDEYYTKQWFFVPELAVEENDKYSEFESSGDIIVTPGNKTDQGFIEEKIMELHREYRVISWAFDDYQGDYVMTRCENNGLDVVNYGQTVKNMSAPMKEVEAMVLAKSLYNDGNECMNWMMGNVVCRLDAKDNIFPRKENDNDQTCKIDGAIGLIMAMGRWMADDPTGSGTGLEFL